MKSVSPGRVSGTVHAPSSKSIFQRAAAAACLAAGTSEIGVRSLSDDALSSLRVVRSLGAVTEVGSDTVRVTGGGRPDGSDLDCGESGLCLRMFTAIAAIYDMKLTLTASGSLGTRPVDMACGPLESLGASCETHNGHAPVTVRGPARGGRVHVDTAVTSQFLTGLLLALPCCQKDSELVVINPVSTPDVRMTMETAAEYGIRIESDAGFSRFEIRGRQKYSPATFSVEGDWSGASFLLVAGAIAGEMTVGGLNPASCQADARIVEALEKAGAAVSVTDGGVSVGRRDLRAFEFDATDCPDLFPPLAALAANCEGTSIIKGADRLVHKESNRARALESEFAKLGTVIKTSDNRMMITGAKYTGGEVDAHGDHRIAMAMATAALTASGRVGISGSESIAKSYPDFFDDLASSGARIE